MDKQIAQNDPSWDGLQSVLPTWDGLQSVLPATTPQAAYVHVPFCRHRCGYCSFTVIAGRDDLISAYIDALSRELAQLGEPRPVTTLFLGGGTPTHLPPADLRRLLSLVTRWFPLADGGELSVEANPADIDSERLAVLADSGVNRLSLGVQSFDSAKLAALERDHDGRRAAEAFVLAKERIASVSLDLIFAAPGEVVDGWRRDLEMAIALGPDHVSTYGLTVEKGTAFWRRRRDGILAEVEEDPQRVMYEMAIDALPAAGYEHYEVSNLARAGHRCRHNEVYWRGEEFFAAGPGASRYVAGRRETNHRSATTYIARVLAGHSPVAEVDELSPGDRARERLVFALRRLEGVKRDWFRRVTGEDIDALVGVALAKFVEQGLMEDDGETIRLTREGLLVSDALWPEFL